MAIQIWDAQAGQYKSADLARFGGSGTLKEALVWDGTQYVKVWPTGPTYTWYDDFTSPTLDSRWSILGGTYSPPGLSGIYLAGPVVDATFEIDVAAAGGTSIYIGAPDFSSVEVTLGISSGLVSLQFDLDVVAYSGATPGVVTLRRADGNWTVLADGDPLPRDGGGIMQIADNVTGTWHIVLGADPGPTHSVGYRELEPVAPLPVVQITGTTATGSRNQFRAACVEYGTTYDTVVELPFLLDTSNATTMSNMFNGCAALTSVPALDTSQVTNMASMFRDCSSLTQVPDMDTSQVTNMGFMFYGCSSLTQVPDLDTSRVTNMASMFRGCSSLTQVPDMDTSQVASTSNMFWGCTSLTDGNVRLIGKHPTVNTNNMIASSGLTREPFYDTNGNPI